MKRIFVVLAIVCGMVGFVYGITWRVNAGCDPATLKVSTSDGEVVYYYTFPKDGEYVDVDDINVHFRVYGSGRITVEDEKEIVPNLMTVTGGWVISSSTLGYSTSEVRKRPMNTIGFKAPGEKTTLYKFQKESTVLNMAVAGRKFKIYECGEVVMMTEREIVDASGDIKKDGR